MASLLVLVVPFHCRREVAPYSKPKSTRETPCKGSHRFELRSVTVGELCIQESIKYTAYNLQPVSIYQIRYVNTMRDIYRIAMFHY